MQTSFSSFVDYQKILATLSTDLKRLREFSQRLNLTHAAIDEVLSRIEANSFTVAVVGEFKRGKSTFINALLGKDILPADVLPCSATLNRVVYGAEPSVLITFKDGQTQTVPIEELHQYVTKLTPDSEVNADKIREATIYYPAAYCHNNVELIDTPGLNDDRNMTEVTLSVLPKVDAAIMVILAQSPFSSYEQDFLENRLLTSDLGRVIFVVTGIDKLNKPDLEAPRLLETIETRIKKYILQRAEQQFGKNSPEYEPYIKKIGKPRIFGLSAYQALEARQNNDAALLTRSKFPEFESALEQFLTRDRGAILLQVPVNRLLASSAEIIKTINIQENALRMQESEFTQAYTDSLKTITTIRERKTQELQRIDVAIAKLKQELEPLMSGLEKELERSATQAVAAYPLVYNDLKRDELIETAMFRLNQQVDIELKRVSQRLSEQIDLHIQREFSHELERLQNFNSDILNSMQHIEMNFDAAQSTELGIVENNSIGSKMIQAAKVVTVGTVGDVGGFLGASYLIGSAVPLALIAASPVVALAALGAMLFAGGWSAVWLASKVSGKSGRSIEQFKADFLAEKLHKLKEQCSSSEFQTQVGQQIDEKFLELKKYIQMEVEALLDNTQNTLSDLQQRRERDQTLTEAEGQELNEIRAEAQKIQGNAQRLSSELVQIMAV